MTVKDVFQVALAVLASVGGGAAIVFALSSWLGKVWASRILEQERAKYANELETVRNGYAHELEKLRSDLQFRAFEHQTRFSYYHQKKAEVIAELYRLLNDSTQRIQELVNPLQYGGDLDRSEKVEATVSLYNQLADHFYSRRIFLDPDICQQVDAIAVAMRGALSKWQRSQRPAFQGKDGVQMWSDAYDTMREAVPPLLGTLEERFRTVLS
jgi:hypothetical protein